MISFLLQEGVITIGTISGIFTALLLNSLKNNIIDPVVEKTVPTVTLLDNIINDLKDDGKLNNSYKNNKNGNNGNNDVKTPQSTILNGPQNTNGNQFGGPDKNKIKWKIFLRDFITWFILMFIIYLAWKHLLNPIKIKNGINIPTTNTQYIPTGIAGMGKVIKK